MDDFVARTHATLGTVRGGTGAERSDASGGAAKRRSGDEVSCLWSIGIIEY